MSELFATLEDLMQRGGWVMWPLTLLSLLATTLIFERCWFWIITNGSHRQQTIQRLGQYLRRDQMDLAEATLREEDSVYTAMVQRLLDEGADEAAAMDAIEAQRPRLERFMSTLGTIITAAPLLGILGTVTGIISALNVLGDEAVTDPAQVAPGIAEALLTTVVGLVVAIGVLFPYNAFRAQIDRALSHMDVLASAAIRKE